MKSPLQRIRLGAFVLGAVALLAIVGFRAGGYNWVESVWMTVVTISSVGYGERSSLSTPMQLFTVGIIIIGMAATAYTLGGLVQLMLEGEIERILGTRRLERDLDRLSGHVIICGFGRIGHILAEDLAHAKRTFVLIENDGDRVLEARQRNFLCLSGDATEEETLKQAGIERAHVLVSALPGDAANVFITLTARNLNSDVVVIARAEHESSGRKLRQAGADRIVMPAVIGAHRIARIITRPSTADMMEQVTESKLLGVELDEIAVPPDSPLVGVTVRETEARRKHGLLVVAIKKSDGAMVFNPDADHAFQPDDIVILMGRNEDVTRFRGEFSV